jgi:hypothetical protein
MPFTPLAVVLPEIAERETRSITTLDQGEIAFRHLFSESFCDEPGCDCRRVFIHVFSDDPARPKPRATISWGWEDAQFYHDWARFPLTDDDLEELKGPALARLQPQSEEAPELLESFRLLLQDPDYAARIEAHYELFRATVEAEAQQRQQRRAAVRKWRPSGKKPRRRRG